MFQGGHQTLSQLGFMGRIHFQGRHWQLDGVFFETVQARKALGGQEVAIDPQMAEAAWPGPIGQLGVDAFAVHHQGAEQTNVLAFELPHQQGGQALWGLWLHRRVVAGAMLGAKFHKQQTQEMPNLGGGADRGLAPASAQTLLDGDRGWDAIDRVHLGPTCGLHDAAGISVQAFQVTALAFVEQNIEGQGGFTRTADTGDHVELATRDVHAQAFQVVLFGVDDADVVVQHLSQVFGRGFLCTRCCFLRRAWGQGGRRFRLAA